MSFYDSIKLIVNIMMILMALVFIIWFLKEIRYTKLNERLNKYTIINNSHRHSLFDIIKNGVTRFREKVSKILYKSNYFKKYSLKYEKFIDKNKDEITDPMDYVSIKFILSFVFVIILIISEVIQNDHITISKFIIAFTLGYFALDIFLLSKRKYVNRQMKNDLLKAITIMNNSFKSGRSIIQTIEIVSREIDGPLKEEFMLVYHDLEYGLELEEAFKRFNSRVDLKEMNYITTSLTILNKTGGNIIDVFSSIEKTVFNNQKLEDELRNLSASSKALYHILVFVPIVFILVIYLLDPTYFMPLFTNSLGIIIIFIIFIIYITYIVLVKKIIKIKEY